MPTGRKTPTQTQTSSCVLRQLLAAGRWFPPDTPVSSTRKLISSSSFHRLDMTLAVAEALNPNKPNQTKCDLAWWHKPLYTVNCADSVWTSHRLIVSAILILKRIAFLVTSDYYFAQAVSYNVVPLVRDVSYVPYVQGYSWSRRKHTFKLPFWHVLYGWNH